MIECPLLALKHVLLHYCVLSFIAPTVFTWGDMGTLLCAFLVGVCM